MPVLDVGVHINEQNNVMYQFYEKPCSNKFTITNSSAHSSRMKMSVLVEEGVRRLRNCSRSLGKEVTIDVMGRWAGKLRRSGYPHTVRHQVVKAAVVKFKTMCKVEEEGGRPVHRPRSWERKERRLQKELKTGGSWCKGNEQQIKAPLIMDPTAGQLSNAVKKVCAEYEVATGIKVSLKLRAGASLKSGCKSEPLRLKECGRPSCFCCASGNPGGCERNGSAYKISCNGCEEKNKVTEYEGETGRILFARGLEHQADLKNRKDESPLLVS